MVRVTAEHVWPTPMRQAKVDGVGSIHIGVGEGKCDGDELNNGRHRQNDLSFSEGTFLRKNIDQLDV